MSHSPEPTIPPQLLAHLRQAVPKRALTVTESLAIAVRQAWAVRELLDIKTPAMPLGWVSELPRVTLEVVPAYQLDDSTSGLTTRQDGRYLIRINKNRPRVHRRFTLAHELKHVIDYPYARLWHAGLGYGDPEAERYRIEKIADHFAANLLMPAMLIKRAWTRGLQSPRTLSAIFEVSVEAMRIRLDTLGLTGDDEQPAATYFRRANFDPSYLTQAV
jgi:Zn-dependent peptidase ImmA (M78 family)